METQRRKLAPDKEYRHAIREAARCLAEGGLVVFPTETVYGVGANAADPVAMARLREVKQRPEDKPFTVHIGSRSAIHRFVPDLGNLGRRLMEKAWPGPLTLIFQVDELESAPIVRDGSTAWARAMYHDGAIGVRCPDDRGAADLLTEARVPVVAASANPAGASAPIDADEAMDRLAGQVDLVLDAGTTRYAGPSTIVRVNGHGYRILREGVLDARTIRRLATLNFLLVCTGNTCRSPMAEGLLRRMLADRLQCEEKDLDERGYHIESTGTGAVAGAPPSAGAVKAMEARGIDITGHRSAPLTVEQINRADHILAMTTGHVEMITAMAAGARDRTRRIDDEDIEDPIGGSDAVYARCARRIEKALRRRMKEIPL